jgi:hypothetical protein
LKHTASARFRQCFERLQFEIQALARRNYALLRADPAHPSLQFKQLAGGNVQRPRGFARTYTWL